MIHCIVSAFATGSIVGHGPLGHLLRIVCEQKPSALKGSPGRASPLRTCGRRSRRNAARRAMRGRTASPRLPRLSGAARPSCLQERGVSIPCELRWAEAPETSHPDRPLRPAVRPTGTRAESSRPPERKAIRGAGTGAGRPHTRSLGVVDGCRFHSASAAAYLRLRRRETWILKLVLIENLVSLLECLLSGLRLQRTAFPHEQHSRRGADVFQGITERRIIRGWDR